VLVQVVLRGMLRMVVVLGSNGVIYGTFLAMVECYASWERGNCGSYDFVYAGYLCESCVLRASAVMYFGLSWSFIYRSSFYTRSIQDVCRRGSSRIVVNSEMTVPARFFVLLARQVLDGDVKGHVSSDRGDDENP
jgi:hypothetical protein